MELTEEKKVSSISQEILTTPIESKTFQWNEIHVGDCVMQAGSTLLLYSDGVGKFQATVWTNHTHSGDQWTHIIDVLDFRGLTLFTCPRWVSDPHMTDGNPPPHYPIGPVFFNYDATNYAAAQSATAHSSC